MGTLLNVQSTVADHRFKLAAFTGHEEISRLFYFTLELTSERPRIIRPEEIIGQKIGFNVEIDIPRVRSTRHFHGYVSRFQADASTEGTTFYQAEVVPQLWLLTRRANCRVFADKTVPDIVEEIFKDHGLSPQWKLKSSDYLKRTYCVQYRETDFNFISRLFEEEGIFYYFEFKEGDHVMVICDDPKHYRTDANTQQVHFDRTIPFVDASVNTWVRNYRFIPGSYSQTDYNYEDHPSRGEQTPANLLHVNKPIVTAGKPPTFDPNKYEVFDYPGNFQEKAEPEGEHYTKCRIEEEEIAYDVISASSVNSHFSAGVKFTLLDHPRREENGDYLLMSVRHSASSAAAGEGTGCKYNNSFMAIPAAVPFRPARRTRKPTVQGSQTAVVVGPPGSEINTDKLGRVQVQFFWDRVGTRLQEEQEEPIWVRVAQLIAGKKWGAMFIPRVGQEVVVTFLEGNPDRPLITGGVYNGEQEPAYNPEDHPTKSGIKTNSSKGGEGFNEIRFEDKADNEQIFMHAQKNMDVRVLSESKERIYGNRHQVIGWEKDGQKGGDQREKVWQDKHLDVKRNQIEHVEGNYQLMVGNGEADDPGKMDVVIEKKETKSVGPDGRHLTVEGPCNESLGSLSVAVGGDHNETSANYAIETQQTIHIKAGTTAVIEAGAQLSLKVGGNFIDISSAGIAIQGTTVLINSGGAPGVGAGASPAAPDAPEQAAPTEPSQADNAESGQKSTPFD